MPEDPRNMATAHRVLAGASLLAVTLAVLSSVASLVELINAPAGVLRWAAAVVLIAVSLCWLLAVLNGGRPSRPNRLLGYVSTLMLIAGAALTGWNVHSPAPAPAIAQQSAGSPPPRGSAVIDSPAPGSRIKTCMIPVRFHGRPAPGRRFVVATRNNQQGYFFESDLTHDDRGDVWTAQVQAGARQPATDRHYTISVFEHDPAQIDYLTGVVSEVEDEATYWPSPRLPPAMAPALDSIRIERVTTDPTCES